MALSRLVKGSAYTLLRPFHSADSWPITVLSGPARAARLTLDLRIEGSYWLGSYDRWILDRFRITDWLPEGGVGWDCGSYVGYYAAIMRKAVGQTGGVHVFEASSANYARLSDLPRINGWNNVRIWNMAVGPDHTSISFAGGLNGSSGPVGLAKCYGGAPVIEQVVSAGLDELHFDYGVPLPDLIKLDLETAEEFALHNGPHVLGAKRPVLLLEWHGAPVIPAVGRFLQEYDYCAWDVLDFDRRDASPLRSEADLSSRFQTMSNTLVCLPTERSMQRQG
jgi:FkbM family methyltransferase